MPNVILSKCHLLVVAISLIVTPVAVFGADVQIIDAPANQQVNVYTEFNVSGKLWIKIAAQTGEPCANFWWIKWPFGAVQQLGKHCGAFVLDIPGVFAGTFGSRLRAGGNDNNLMIAISANESVAHTVTITFP